MVLATARGHVTRKEAAVRCRGNAAWLHLLVLSARLSPATVPPLDAAETGTCLPLLLVLPVLTAFGDKANKGSEHRSPQDSQPSLGPGQGTRRLRGVTGGKVGP